MHLKVSYSEINSFITKKINQPLHVKYGYDKKMDVKYTYRTNVFLVGEVKKDISISLSIYSVSSDTVVLQANSGAVVGFFLPTILNSVADKNKLNFLSASGDKITLRLSQIPGASSALQTIRLDQIDVTTDGLDVQATFR